ncbi:MAG: phospholipid/cholesterol/gamma-HCH transport system substrate-binding protein [Halieaceae bacterium]|jgi:phospholipid/cholesterol/gamma-HCH transport system substrate-binding protein
MERQARFILVGFFLLLTISGLILFYNWITAANDVVNSEPRDIQFQGSVSGLSIGSDVRYLGVQIGRVSSITLSPSEAGRVDVAIESSKGLPAAEQLIAALEAQGITGLSIIELRDKQPGEASFPLASGVIAGYPSLLSRLSTSADDITASTAAVLTKINTLLSEENLTALSGTIAEAQTLTTNLAAASVQMEELVASVTRITAELEETLPDYRAMAISLDQEMVPAVVAAGNSLQDASDAVAEAVGTNQPQLRRLLQKDLPTLIGLTDDLARSLDGINQTMGNINDEPGAIFFGEQVREVEISLE